MTAHTLSKYRPWAACWVALATLVAVAARAQDASSDGAVLARVGTRSVTRAALVSHLLDYYGRSTLQALTNVDLIRLEAERLKVTLSDADVDARAGELKKRLGDFAEALKAEGVDEQTWRERVRHGLLTEKVLAAKWPVRPADLTRMSLRYVRVQSEKEAKAVISEARQKVRFDHLARTRSLDKGDGLVQPNPFIRAQQPYWFKMGSEAGLRVGQVTPQPIPAGELWLVLKLEGVMGPETLSASDRQKLTDFVMGMRSTWLVPTLRKRVKIETVVPVADLTADPKKAPDTVLVRAGTETVTYKDLLRALFENYARAGIEQLIQRSILDQEAAKLGVTISDAELDARVNQVKTTAKVNNADVFQAALAAEGITEQTYRGRVRYAFLAEKVLNARSPVDPKEFERMTVAYIRVPSKEAAETVIQRAMGGAPWLQLRQFSLDQAGDGLLRPRAFVRLDQPTIYKTIDEAKLEPGAVLSQPVQVGNSWAVLKLEARFPAEQLSATERQSIIRRINAARMPAFQDEIRKSAEVEYPVPADRLIAAIRS
jgi:foldase protein PrsA